MKKTTGSTNCQEHAIRPTQVLIIDDVDLMRELLVQVFQSDPKFKVSGWAKNSAEAYFALRKNRPDIVLLDEVLPGESSKDILDTFFDEKIPVILITGMANPVHPIPKRASCRILKPSWENIEEGKNRMINAIHKALGLKQK